MQVRLLTDKREIVIKGVPTQWIAERIIRDMNEIIVSSESDLAYFFEGEPGPFGEGLTIRVRYKTLSEGEVNALRKYFELKKVLLDVV
ncbi:MAG: hypothetical protein QXP80_06990 [Zestosphaera sp.]